MTFKAKIIAGQVVLDHPLPLADGTDVIIETQTADEEQDNKGQSLGLGLLDFVGKAKGLPPDASRNVDHYLYGTPKK